MATPTRSRWRSSRPAGARSRSAGSCQIRWDSTAGRDAGDVGGGRGRPVELGEGGLGGGEKRRHHLVTGEDSSAVSETWVRRSVSSARSGSRRIEPGAREPGVAVGDAEGQARDDLGADREAAGLQREALVVGVEAEAFAGAVRVGDAQQTLAAEVDVEAGFLQRPVGGHLDAGEGEIDGAVAGAARRRHGRAGSPSNVQPSSGTCARMVQRSSSISRLRRRSVRCRIGQVSFSFP